MLKTSQMVLILLLASSLGQSASGSSSPVQARPVFSTLDTEIFGRLEVGTSRGGEKPSEVLLIVKDSIGISNARAIVKRMPTGTNRNIIVMRRGDVSPALVHACLSALARLREEPTAGVVRPQYYFITRRTRIPSVPSADRTVLERTTTALRAAPVTEVTGIGRVHALLIDFAGVGQEE